MAAAPHQLPGRLRACHALSTGCIPSEPSAAVLKQAFANKNLAEARGTRRIITHGRTDLSLQSPLPRHQFSFQGLEVPELGRSRRKNISALWETSSFCQPRPAKQSNCAF